MGEEYEVLELIGRGSFGQIHKVRRIRDGLILARKEISYNRMSAKEKEQLTAEFSILSKLQHPNIVRYYNREHNKLDQSLYIYMEYCGGGDLSTQIKRCKANGTLVPENVVWSIFTQIVLALYKCHNGVDPPSVDEMSDGWERKKGGVAVVTTAVSATCGAKVSGREVVVHRDLKPENVFLDDDTCVKLGDFGLSRILASEAHMATTYVGTPYYMSPEIVCDLPYTSRSDIWSLGCVIYELCSLSPPFDAKSLPSLCQKIQAGRYSPIPSSYSPELRRVVDSCLRTNPSERPDTAKLLDLQIMRTMRREIEALEISRSFKAKEEALRQKEKEIENAQKNMSKILEEAASRMRLEIDAELRKVWDEKAEDEIRRRVDLEVQRRCGDHEIDMKRQYKEALEAMRVEFQTVLDAQVKEEVEKRVQEEFLTRQIGELGVLERNTLRDSIHSVTGNSGEATATSLPEGRGSPTDPLPSIVRSNSLDDIHNLSKSEEFMPASPMDITMLSPMQGIKDSFYRRQHQLQQSPLQSRKLNGGRMYVRSTSLGFLNTNSGAVFSDDSSDEEAEEEYDEDDSITALPQTRMGAFGRPYPLNNTKSAPGVPLASVATGRQGLQRVYSAPPTNYHNNMVSNHMNYRDNTNPKTPPRGRRVSSGGNQLRPNPGAENRQLSPNRKLDFSKFVGNAGAKGVGVKAAVMNHTRAKSLLELQKERSRKERELREKENDEVPVWDPNVVDEMPSPFLSKKTRVF